ncbi:ATP-binding protein [Streptomyces chattanoogensis]|uniref:ATP-binding protein n=1 Tax=Streptomyces chattanoogensis TaxID=66876 RepID=UPI0036C3DD7A
MKIERMAVSFPPDERRVEHMRRLAAAHLNRFGRIDPEVVHAVQLLVSEIVTNAIQHGKGADVDFYLTCDPSSEVRIEVDDHSPGAAEVQTPGPNDETGRGLLLVAAFASDWGRTGTRTWCTVPTRRVAA